MSTLQKMTSSWSSDILSKIVRGRASTRSAGGLAPRAAKFVHVDGRSSTAWQTEPRPARREIRHQQITGRRELVVGLDATDVDDARREEPTARAAAAAG